MELFRMIKSDAKRAMRFCGGRAVAAMFVVALALLAINLTETVVMLVFFGKDFIYNYESVFAKGSEAYIISACSCFLWFLIIPQIIVGYKKLNLSFAEGNDESISMLFDIFSSFKKFFGSFFFGIAFALRLAFTFAIAVLPGGAFLWFSENYIPESNRTLSILKIFACVVAVAIIILCISLWIIFIQRWSLAVYYYADGTGIQKSFSLSAKAAKGIHTKILSFKLSFIVWTLPSLLILPLIWILPYYELSNAIFAKYLMEKYEHSLAEVPETVEPETTSEEAVTEESVTEETD